MSPAQAFRLQAAECRQWGIQATDEEDKAFWLGVAAEWLQLAEMDVLNERAAAKRLYGSAASTKAPTADAKAYIRHGR
jgi:hypothetical protein